jgi:hypothetical protein
MSKSVREHYRITEEDLSKLNYLSRNSKYWSDAESLVNSVIDINPEALTVGQKLWLEQILSQIQS